jgi:hypothetical protein
VFPFAALPVAALVLAIQRRELRSSEFDGSRRRWWLDTSGVASYIAQVVDNASDVARGSRTSVGWRSGQRMAAPFGNLFGESSGAWGIACLAAPSLRGLDQNACKMRGNSVVLTEAAHSITKLYCTADGAEVVRESKTD